MIDWRRTLCVTGFAVLLATGIARAQGQTGYVLTTNNTLYTIDVDNPTVPLATVIVTGLAHGEKLAGIDVRPENGMLYALAVRGGAWRPYFISPRTGVAVPTAPWSVFFFGAYMPNPDLSHIGIDFTPKWNSVFLSVITNEPGGHRGQNIRTPIDDSRSSSYPSFLPTAVQIDEIAHTNNERDATVTTMYGIGSAEDMIYIEETPIVPLSRDLTDVHGFALDSNARVATSDQPVLPGSSAAFAVVTADGMTGLTRIDLLTGEVGPIVPIAGGIPNVRGFAVRDAAVPGNFPAVALTSGGTLVGFDTAAPGTNFSTFTPGMRAGVSLVAIDYRPQTGELFGLTFDSPANQIQLVRLGNYLSIGSPITLTHAGATSFGFDFNPTVDRVRVVTNAGEQLRWIRPPAR